MMTIPPKPPVPPQIFPRVCDHRPDGVQTALAWCCFKAEALNPAHSPMEDNSVDKQLKMSFSRLLWRGLEWCLLQLVEFTELYSLAPYRQFCHYQSTSFQRKIFFA